MNVLLAVDQSRNSSAAAQFVKAFGLPARSTLYLLRVIEPQERLPGPDHLLSEAQPLREEISSFRQQTMEKAQQLVNRLAASFHAQDLEVHPLVVEGIPGGEILTAIEKYQIDLVAMGTKGLSGMKRFLLGSVSEWVLYDASCSVLVVRGRPQWEDESSSHGPHVLLAIDGSSDSLKAVALIKTLHLPETSRLTLLHVVEQAPALSTLTWVSDHTDSTPLTEDCRLTGQQTGTQLLEKTQRELMGEKFEIDTKLAEGHAADEILKSAQDIQTDLIVVGSKGVTGLRRMMMLGGVSHKVVRHAPCSVLVVRNDPSA